MSETVIAGSVVESPKTNVSGKTKKKDVEALKDTAFFGFVNQHAEEMKKQRKIAENTKRAKKLSRMKKLNIAYYVVMGLCLAFLGWVFISWVNVIMHNTTPGGYQYIWSWNFFKVFF